MTTILLVDDERLVLRSLEKTLLRVGFDVIAAVDCATGWEAFDANSDAIDLAIFDLNMPGFDGISFEAAGLSLLKKALEKNPNLLCIVLTAYDELGKAREAVALGAKAYFVKGREQGLVELIQKTLSQG